MEVPPLEAQDAEVLRQSTAAAMTEIALLDEIILLINRGAARLDGTKHDHHLNMLSSILLARAFNTLYRARQDAVQGYCATALILCRAAMEDWATMVWVSGHPDDVEIWLWSMVDDIKQPTRKPPTFDSMFKSRADAAVLLVIYDQLSKFAHPRSIGLSAHVTFDEENTYFQFGPRFDQQDLRVTLSTLVMVAAAFLEQARMHQERSLGNADEVWVTQANAAVDRGRSFIATVIEDAKRDQTRGAAARAVVEALPAE